MVASADVEEAMRLDWNPSSTATACPLAEIRGSTGCRPIPSVLPTPVFLGHLARTAIQNIFHAFDIDSEFVFTRPNNV